MATVSSLTEHVEQREEMAKKNQPQEKPLDDGDVYSKERARLNRIVVDPSTTEDELKEMLMYWDEMKRKQADQK